MYMNVSLLKKNIKSWILENVSLPVLSDTKNQGLTVGVSQDVSMHSLRKQLRKSSVEKMG